MGGNSFDNFALPEKELAISSNRVNSRFNFAPKFSVVGKQLAVLGYVFVGVFGDVGFHVRNSRIDLQVFQSF